MFIKHPIPAVRTTRLRFTASSLAILALLSTTACSRQDQPAAPAVSTTNVVAVDTPPPAYPMELACDQIGGTVELMVTIGTDGRPTGIRTTGSSGFPALDAAALEAARGWKFRPATRNGQPVETQIRVPMNFRAPAERPEDCA